MKKTNLSVALAINQAILRKGISQYIRTFGGYTIVIEIGDQTELSDTIKTKTKVPDFCIIDIHDRKTEQGKSTIAKIKSDFPSTKIIALIADTDPANVSKFLLLGSHCLLSKDSEPAEIRTALEILYRENNYHSERIKNLARKIDFIEPELKEKEIKFISLCCSELTYKEIADHMGVSIRTVEAIREGLFKKFNTVSKTGLVLKALRQNIISIN